MSFGTNNSTIASCNGTRGEFCPPRLISTKNGINNVDVDTLANDDKNKGTQQEMPIEEGEDDTAGVGTLASTKKPSVNVFDNKEGINKEDCIQQEKLAEEIEGGVGALASTKNQGINVFVYADKEENVDQEKSAKEIVIPAAKIFKDRDSDWKKKFQEWKKRKDDAAGEGTLTQKSLLSSDYSGDWKSKKPPSLLLKSRSSVAVGSRMINENPSLASHVDKARSPDSGVWKNKKPRSPHVDGRDRDTYEVKGGTNTVPEMPDMNVLPKCNKNKGTRREKLAGEVDGRNRSRSRKGHRQSSSDTDVIGGGTKALGVEELVRNVLTSSGEVTKRRRKKRPELV